MAEPGLGCGARLPPQGLRSSLCSLPLGEAQEHPVGAWSTAWESREPGGPPRSVPMSHLSLCLTNPAKQKSTLTSKENKESSSMKVWGCFLLCCSSPSAGPPHVPKGSAPCGPKGRGAPGGPSQQVLLSVPRALQVMEQVRGQLLT